MIEVKIYKTEPVLLAKTLNLDKHVHVHVCVFKSVVSFEKGLL